MIRLHIDEFALADGTLHIQRKKNGDLQMLDKRGIFHQERIIGQERANLIALAALERHVPGKESV